MITLPRFLSSIFRSRVYHPRMTLREDPCLHVVRWGLMPDGQEQAFGSTVTRRLDESLDEYRACLRQAGIRVMAPVEILGTDFLPYPAKSGKAETV